MRRRVAAALYAIGGRAFEVREIALSPIRSAIEAAERFEGWIGGVTWTLAELPERCAHRVMGCDRACDDSDVRSCYGSCWPDPCDCPVCHEQPTEAP